MGLRQHRDETVGLRRSEQRNAQDLVYAVEGPALIAIGGQARGDLWRDAQRQRERGGGRLINFHGLGGHLHAPSGEEDQRQCGQEDCEDAERETAFYFAVAVTHRHGMIWLLCAEIGFKTLPVTLAWACQP